MSNMNGMMQFHGHNNPGLGQPGPGGPLGPGHNINHATNGGSQHMVHHPSVPQKRPLDEDTKNTPDTAKRLNLDNGNSSDGSQNSVKREPSPLESKFQPGGSFPTNSVQSNNTSSNNYPEHSTEVKPVVHIKTEDTATDFKSEANPSQEEQDSKIKSEVDPLKQEDALCDLDMNDWTGFEGINVNEDLTDIMDDLGFDNNFFSSIGEEDGDLDDKLNDPQDPTTTSSQGLCHTSSPDDSQTNSVSTMSRMPGGSGPPPSTQPNAAEALKLMAAQHQQEGGPPTSLPYPAHSYTDRNYPVPSSAIDSRACPPPGLSSAPVQLNQSINEPINQSAGPPGMMVRGRMQDGDPRLRAAVQQRFRLGNPMSVANSMAGAMPNQPNPMAMSSMSEQQRMEMMRSNPNMMSMGPGQNPNMGPGMGMMGQQVSYVFHLTSHLFLKICFSYLYVIYICKYSNCNLLIFSRCPVCGLE